MPGAQADFTLGEQKFIHDMQKDGIIGRPDDKAVVNAGYEACRMLAGRVAKGVVVNKIAEESLQAPANYSGGAISNHQALLLVNAAWVDLCPDLNVPDM